MYIHRWLHTFLFLYTAFKHVSVSASEDVSYTFNTSVMFHICMYCSLFNQSVGFTKKKSCSEQSVYTPLLTYTNKHIEEGEILEAELLDQRVCIIKIDISCQVEQLY